MSLRSQNSTKLLHPHPRQTQDLVRAIAVSKDFSGKQVLNGVDLAVRRGEVLVIMGPSGCGKTTMLHHLCGLLEPSSGRVSFDGRNIYAMNAYEQSRMRLRTGVSFQGGALLGSLTVEENVQLPLVENSSMSRALIRQIARMKLDMVGMLHAAEQLPASLSGGMKKRAAIARAIALDPEIVYFDEPSAGLDPITAAEVDNLISKLNKVFGITMVVVTHDLPSADEIADRIVMLIDGEVAALGDKEDVWKSGDERIVDFIARRIPEGQERSTDFAEYLTI